MKNESKPQGLLSDYFLKTFHDKLISLNIQRNETNFFFTRHIQFFFIALIMSVLVSLVLVSQGNISNLETFLSFSCNIYILFQLQLLEITEN